MTTYIKLFAGLGNQIFQFLYGKKLELQGKKVKYILCRSKNKAGIYTDFPGVFELSEKDLKKIYMPEGSLSNIKRSLRKAWAKYICRDYQTGFYQKISFIESVDIAYTVSDLLRFKNESSYRQTQLYQAVCNTQNSVSLHIRGGDYLTAAGTYGGICTADYYSRAISHILENVQKPHFFVFSNDSSYAASILSKLEIPQTQYTIVNDPAEFASDPGFDLFLMTNCTHNIIANSTYSWWGAFLNRNKNKIVISPSKWTNDSQPSLEDIKPETWHTV